MLKIALTTFLDNLDCLDQHLSLQQRTNEIYDKVNTANIPEDLKSSVCDVLHKNAEEKTFDYNANVISLYGYWENFIESLIKEFLLKLKTFDTKDDSRNKNVSSQYKKYTFPLFDKIRRKSPKFCHLTDKDLIDSLYMVCSQKLNEYIPEPFFQSGGNYNYNETSNCFKRLGFTKIDNELQRYPSLMNYFLKEGYKEETIKNASNETLYVKLNNLVIMRNEIAHGAKGTSIIDATGIKTYLLFMKALGKALNEFLNDDLYSLLWTKRTCEEIKIGHYYARHNVGEIVTGNYFIDKTREVLFSNREKVIPHYGCIHIKEIYVNDMLYDDDKYLSLKTTDKVTISFKEPIRKGMLLKFEA